MTDASDPTPPLPPLGSAQLTWDDQGQPHSTVFDDCYFSRDNGLEETRYVFLQHNRLPERFAALGEGERFVVAETGFGTGLNFLACWELWRTTATPSARLHFISVEKYPLRHEDLQHALSMWPEISKLSEALLEQYPPLCQQGFHRLQFDAGKVILTLIIDDACDGLEQLLQAPHPLFRRPFCAVNAWFLDGFAPAKNPQMWQPELFERIQQLSAPDATAATFSAAGVVKRGLREHGFRVRRTQGFGHKREMVCAELISPYTHPPAGDFPTNGFNSPYPAPWYCDGHQTRAVDASAIVVGAGIAGAHTARALAERGWNVTVLERHPQAACEGSGNPQGVLYAKLSHRPELLSAFNLAALLFAQNHYAPMWQSAHRNAQSTALGERCGVLQLAYDAKTEQLQRKLQQTYADQGLFQWLDANQASHIAGVELSHGGIFFPHCGWLSPRSVCAERLDHPLIQTHYDTDVVSLDWQSAEQQWHLQDAKAGHWHSRTVVLTTAADTKRLPPTALLPLKAIRGQVTYLQSDAVSQQLNTVLCGSGYMAPAQDGSHCLGATFDQRDLELTVRPDEHDHNLESLRSQVSGLVSSLILSSVTGGRSALRCSTPDYLPLVGPVPDYAALNRDFDLLQKNARANLPFGAQYCPGLFVNTGHGSRGLAYTPLCAELLASEIHGDPLPVGRDMRTALHPGRFWIRDLIRNKSR